MEYVQVVILGDPFNNTLGLIRSLGEANIGFILILVGNEDRLFVSKSKYIKSDCLYCINKINDSLDILLNFNNNKKLFLIATNDIAAKFIDDNEPVLSDFYITPMNGKHIGNLFQKNKQCLLAKQCGLDVPKSLTFERNDSLEHLDFFPLLLKPILSTKGEKSDIHICYNKKELNEALKKSSKCNSFIVQEYIEKDFEINILGVSTKEGIVCPGGIKKIRHYPTIYSPCSFGKYISIKDLSIDVEAIKSYISNIGYIGLFSVEFLKKGDKFYFMEFNFRNDGLAYTATCAGINMPEILIKGEIPSHIKFKSIYMMDYSIDFCHVKDGNISLLTWIIDFIKTKCHLYLNFRDINPLLQYYKSKICSKIIKKRRS